MDEQTSHVLAQWMPYLLSAGLAFIGAASGTLGVLIRKLWAGGSYYMEKAWALADKAVNKHLEFTDSLSASLNAQTELLAEIKAETTKAAKVIDQLGSDPTGSGEIKTLVTILKDKPQFCKYEREEIERYLKVILKHKQQQKGQA